MAPAEEELSSVSVVTAEEVEGPSRGEIHIIKDLALCEVKNYLLFGISCVQKLILLFAHPHFSVCLSITRQAIVPAGKPALLAPLGWGIFHTAGKDALSGCDKFLERIIYGIVHLLEYLAQAPSLSLVALLGVGPFAFKVEVVDKGVLPLGS